MLDDTWTLVPASIMLRYCPHVPAYFKQARLVKLRTTETMPNHDLNTSPTLILLTLLTLLNPIF